MKPIFLLAIGLLFSSNIWAADGSSGCGPGWYIFKENSLVSSAFRQTTNTILLPVVTIGMTFGTSNCTRHKIVKHEKRSLHFATMSFYELKSDIAKGGGEHVSAFTATVGCPASATQHAAKQFQKNFNKIYPDSQVDPERALGEVYKVIFSDTELTQKCVLGVG